ncbi:hypothetical protein WISP_28332 [Willisornis vidua]|uniref:Retroviral nucleocapsid Gag protein p24 C-terminal domain-containing protein n=1 Tax=Willisornis vidua TaxID=1566151 RepID=A0ABQ9DRU2_9PASS|nr:hypothetical protein WISP_28332 [Willisornis vidua]
MFLDEWLALITKHAHETVDTSRWLVQQTIDMLYGQGAYAYNPVQARFPVADLITTKNLALQTLQTIADASEVMPPFQTVIQKPNETFFDFAERLKEAIERETKEKAVQDILFKQLAISNANSQCQQVLRTLKDPTPLHMVKACKDISPHDKLADTLAQGQPSMGTQLGNQLAKSNKQLVKNVVKDVTQALTMALESPKVNCYHCNELGHLKVNGPKLQN